MGGQTIRMLAQLLAQGTKGAPVQEDPTSHPLFAGGHGDWIHSITTLASPNQGTLLADGFSLVGDLAKDLIIGVFSLSGVFGPGSTTVYDPKLDQWGITPKSASEDIKSYLDRVFGSDVFKPGFKDISIYSLSTVGAAEENTWVTTLPNVYYFSLTTQDTMAGKDAMLRNVQLPRMLSMWTLLQENDGVVDTVSQVSDGKGELVEGVAVSKPGRWHHVGLLSGTDHEAAVGVKALGNIYDIYPAQAKLLQSLPKSSTDQQGRLLKDDAGHQVPEDVERELQHAIERASSAMGAPKRR